MKELCECGKKATWIYGPGFNNGDSPFFCDNCVPRGCECNYMYIDINIYDPPLDEPEIPDGVEGIDWIWVKKNKIWQYIDSNGLPFPCMEFEYNEKGFDVVL